MERKKKEEIEEMYVSKVENRRDGEEIRRKRGGMGLRMNGE
ncbi:hypothetical protein [Salmonella enterica]|nr:hypothetical protein [Salmonella enterica]